MPCVDHAHDALSIVFFVHAGYLQSYESDENRRLLRGDALIDAMEYRLEPHYDLLWRSTGGEPEPSDFIRCRMSTLPDLRETLARLLRLLPHYVAIPLRVIPADTISIEETLGVFRDEIDIQMQLRGLCVPWVDRRS